MAPAPLPPPLACAVALDHARELCAAAHEAITTAQVQVDKSTRLRRERASWNGIRDALSREPDHRLVACAYCERVRTSQGEWVTIPGGVRAAVRHWAYVLLSHTYCSDCLSKFFGGHSVGG